MLRRLALAYFVPFLFLAAAEGILEMAGYRRDLPPIIFETREPNADAAGKRVLQHPVLLFTFNPGTIYNAVRINSLGYREREVEAEKKPGSKRVICFGDSITAQGRPNYSKILHDRLQAEPPTAEPWEAFNMAVYGYSSRQGLAVFRLQGKALRPDYITVYFGPNDRNLHEVMDKQRMGKALPPWRALLAENVQDKRLGQWVLGTARDVALARQKEVKEGDKVPRVPPDDYEEVMRSFVREAREIGAEALLLTAPRRNLGRGLISAGYAVSLEKITARHDDYNEIVRKVAAEMKAPLVDLAREMEGPEFDHMFAADGIHFDAYATEHAAKPESQPGLEYIAGAIHRTLLELHR